MSSKKQMMDIQPINNVSAAMSDEHQRNWGDELFERKVKDPDHNYDRSRVGLNFQIFPGGIIGAIDKSKRIGKKIDEIIKTKVTGRVNIRSNRAVSIVFGGNRERMRELAFGNQELHEFEETNGGLVRQAGIEQWALDTYRFACKEWGEENIVSFIVHLDEQNPHAHLVFVPVTKDGRLSAKEIVGGENKIEAAKKLRDLHSRYAEVTKKYGLDRGDDIHETGARHRSTSEYNRDLHRENAAVKQEINDGLSKLQLINEAISKGERKYKGLSTMVRNLESRQAELEAQIQEVESQLQEGRGDRDQLLANLENLKGQYYDVARKLKQKQDACNAAGKELDKLRQDKEKLTADKEKLQLNVDWLEGRKEDLQAIAMSLSEDVRDATQHHILKGLCDLLVNDFSKFLKDLPEYYSDQLDSDVLRYAVSDTRSLFQCATWLFLGAVDQASSIAQSAGGGGSTSDLPWHGRDKDEDFRHFAYRCIRHAAAMLRPTQRSRSWHR